MLRWIDCSKASGPSVQFPQSWSPATGAPLFASCSCDAWQVQPAAAMLIKVPAAESSCVCEELAGWGWWSLK